MYGFPGLRYEGVRRAKKPVRFSRKDARMIYSEYCCLYPTTFYRQACEDDCPVKGEAKCRRNGWDWMKRTVGQ